MSASTSEQRPSPTDAASTAVSVRELRNWLVVIVGLGVLWRVLRYGLRFPFWGDESFLNTSLLVRSYAGLLAPLEYFQVAPLGYLWLQKTMFILFGGGEYALRVVALLAGLAALALFIPFAWRTLPPRAAAIAIGIFSGSYYLVRHTCESKQYATDLFAAMLLFWLAWRWLEKPAAWTRGLLLASAAVIMVWLSFPAVFVAAGVGLTLLVVFWRSGVVKSAWLAWLGYNTLVALSFLGVYAVFIAPHAVRTQDSWLEDYWRYSFPPGEPLALVWWLIKIHCGRMMAYPLGAENFGSIATTALVITGVVALWRLQRGKLALLVLSPLVFTLTAAALEKYPYGGSVRVAIFMAPAFCLLAGAGAGWLIDRGLSGKVRDTAGALVGAFLVLLPIGGIVHDLRQPYKDEGDWQIRAAMRAFAQQVSPQDTIVIYNPMFGTEPPMFHASGRYYLEHYTGIRPRWYEQGGLSSAADWVLVMHGPYGGPTDAQVRASVRSAGLQVLTRDDTSLLPVGPAKLRVYRVAEL